MMRTAVPLAMACCLTACLLPHVERIRAGVHGVVTLDGAPVPGVLVARCTRGWGRCETNEYATTAADGTFDLPVGRTFSLFLALGDPISDPGFELRVDGQTYCGLIAGGIGRPLQHYDVRCELAGATPLAPSEPLDYVAGHDKSVCKRMAYVR